MYLIFYSDIIHLFSFTKNVIKVIKGGIDLKFKKVISTLSIATMLLAFSGCTKDLDLSINIKTGDKYVIHEVTNQDMTMTLGTQQMATNQTVDMNLLMDVKDVDKDKNVTIEYKYDSMKMSASSNGQTMTYDSTKADDSNPLNEVYKGIIGKSFTVKMSNKGKLLEIKGVTDLINSMLDKVNVPDAQKETLKSSLTRSFGDDAIKSMVQQSMDIYPDKAVKKNDTWNKKYDIKTVFPITVDNTFKLLSNDSSEVSLNQQSNITADTKGTPIDIMGVKSNINLTGTATGTVKINKSNGLLQSGEVTENMNGEMQMLKSSLIPQDIKVPMKMTAKITYDIKKK